MHKKMSIKSFLFFYKNVIFNAFYAYLSKTPIFIKWLCRAAEESPPSPSLAEWEVGEYWLFLSHSRGFGYGLEAVRIRVS
jgi:hypothetical protein